MGKIRYKPLEIGETFQSKSGNTFSIMEIVNSDKITIRFNDEFMYERVVSATDVRSGRIKNPFYGKVFGIGYLGVGKHKSKLGPTSQGYQNTPEYNSWINMLSRCYYDKYTNRDTGNRPYDNTIVSKEWHNFQTFAEWYLKESDRISSIKNGVVLALDKDLLGSVSKMYSPNTCCLIPRCINSEIRDNTKKLVNGELSTLRLMLNGVYCLRLAVNGKSFQIKRPTALDCVNYYIDARENNVRNLAEEHKQLLTPKVYAALINYELIMKDVLIATYTGR